MTVDERLDELERGQGKLLAEVAGVSTKVDDLKTAVQRFDDRLWEEATGSHKVPSKFSVRPEFKTGGLVAGVVVVCQAIIELAKYVAGVPVPASSSWEPTRTTQSAPK